MDDFNFVKDNKLKRNLIDSVKFISFLWLLAQKNKRKGVSEEIYRAIILYSASIVEALLLNYCKRKNMKFFEIKYSKDHSLPSVYQTVLDISKYQEGKVVLAVKHKVVKKDNGAITFSDLLDELETFLGKHLVVTINEVKDIRNTLHLHKTRNKKLGIKDTEKATKVVLEVVEKLSKEAGQN